MKNFVLPFFIASLISLSTNAQTISWANHVGSDRFDNLESHAVDKDENIIAVGYFEKTVQIGETELTSRDESDIFIYKTNSNGIIEWAHTFGGPVYGGDVGVAVDGDGNIYLAGGFIQQLFFDDGLKLTANNNYWNSFVAKLNPDGSLVWVKGILGTETFSEVRVWGCIAVTEAGDVAVSGIFSGDISIDGNTLIGDPGSSYSFLARFNSSGNVIWIKTPTLSYVTPNEILIDKNNFIYITGFFSGTVQFDGHSLTAANSSHSDIFLVKYDFLGNVVWAKAGVKATSVELNNQGRSLAVDNETNDVYLTGIFKGTVKFDSFSIVGINTSEDPGNADIFITKFNSLGTVQWAKRIGTNGNDIADHISITPQEKIIISGGKNYLFYEIFDLDGNSLSTEEFNCFGSISKVSEMSNGDRYFSGHLYSDLITPEVEIIAAGEADGFLFKIANCNSVSSLPIKPEVTAECKVLTVTNDSNHRYQIEWYKDAALISEDRVLSLSANDEGTYTAHFINSCGSNAGDPYLFENPDIEIYNVITPNGDPTNEVYILTDPLFGSSLSIYNRWGSLVYQNPNYQNTWTGEGLSTGVYYYNIRSTCYGEFKGSLSILR